MRLLLYSLCTTISIAAPTKLPSGLVSAWSQFQQAIKHDDIDALAKVTKFPLRSNEFGGDIKSVKVLRHRYATIFPAKTKQCLLASTLKQQGTNKAVFYEVFCDVSGYPIRFIFKQTGSRFLLTTIDNINE